MFYFKNSRVVVEAVVVVVVVVVVDVVVVVVVVVVVAVVVGIAESSTYATLKAFYKGESIKAQGSLSVLRTRSKRT